MKKDVNKRLQAVVRYLLGFQKIPNTILLLQQGIQVNRASGTSSGSKPYKLNQAEKFDFVYC